MAGGFTKDGAVQDQIDASLEDEIKRVRGQLPRGESAFHCEQCGEVIPEARREVVPGVRFCIVCQESADSERTAVEGYNRRGSKDSQLR